MTESGEGISRRFVPPSDALVILGGTGDLAFRKIYPALYELERAGRLHLPIVVTGALARDGFTAMVMKSITAAHPRPSSDVLHRLMHRMDFFVSDLRTRAAYVDLGQRCRGYRPTFFFALPPSLTAAVAYQMSKIGLTEAAALMIEKPFGVDLASARHLESHLRRLASEEAIFRIDHYLAKRSMLEAMSARSVSPAFSRLLDREVIERMTIRHSETRGLQGRGRFYDGVGAVRDVVQSHLLQLAAMLAVRPTAESGRRAAPDRVFRAETQRFLGAVQTLDPDLVVRGQYEGYRREDAVSPSSTTETFVAVQMAVDLPEWRDVPVVLSSGKALKHNCIDVVLELRDSRSSTVTLGFGQHLSLSATGEGRELVAAVGSLRDLPYRALCSHEDFALGSYAQLLTDGLFRDHVRFQSFETVAEGWRIVEPALRRRALMTYPMGMDGRKLEDQLQNRVMVAH
nr:hypothetical protein [Kineosporia babensis]